MPYLMISANAEVLQLLPGHVEKKKYTQAQVFPGVTVSGG